MRMQHFTNVARGVDIEPLVAELDAAPEAWLADTTGSASGIVRQFQLDTIRIDGFSLRGEERFSMDISSGWKISATNSARPLTPVFA